MSKSKFMIYYGKYSNILIQYVYYFYKYIHWTKFLILIQIYKNIQQLWFDKWQRLKRLWLPVVEYPNSWAVISMFLCFWSVFVWVSPLAKLAFKDAVFILIRCPRFSPLNAIIIYLDYIIWLLEKLWVTCALYCSGISSMLRASAI